MDAADADRQVEPRGLANPDNWNWWPATKSCWKGRVASHPNRFVMPEDLVQLSVTHHSGCQSVAPSHRPGAVVEMPRNTRQPHQGSRPGPTSRIQLKWALLCWRTMCAARLSWFIHRKSKAPAFCPL